MRSGTNGCSPRNSDSRTQIVRCGTGRGCRASASSSDRVAAGWAGSTFVVETAPRVWPALRDLTRGRVLFTVPPEPAPCGATALKPLFMACDHWRRSGVLADLDVHLVLPGPVALGVEKADRVVERELADGHPGGCWSPGCTSQGSTAPPS